MRLRIPEEDPAGPTPVLMRGPPDMPAQIHRGVLVTRSPERRAALEDNGFGGTDQLATAEGSWRISLDKAKAAKYLFVQTAGEITDAATILDAERVPRRRVAAHPELNLEGRVRFITSHEVPSAIERLIGTTVGSNRNPVSHIEVHHDPINDTATIFDPDAPRGAAWSDPLADVTLATSRRQFDGPSRFGVEVGTTGFRGRDAGHGSRAILIFENLAATTWSALVEGRHEGDHPDRVILRFGGDSEIENLARALEFAASALRACLDS